MSRKRFTAEQIIVLSGEGDVKLSQGRNVGQVSRDMGITEQIYYRWRKEYGGMKTVQVKRLKDLERENGRLGLRNLLTLLVAASVYFSLVVLAFRQFGYLNALEIRRLLVKTR